jgi:hypothetical protein
LNEQLRNGRVTFWGRIDHASLPEFYSRSTLLVVPSFREQFGMVAVEAMMCGCAVLAARVGGLQDLVVAGRTGTLFDRGSAAALAACLASYLACPRLAEWHGQNAAFWARARFSVKELLPAFEATLAGTEPTPQPKYQQTAESAFVEQSILHLTQTAERLLGRRSVGHADLTSSQSISWRLELEDGANVFVKQYSRRPRFLETIHGENAAPPVADPAAYRLALMRHLSGRPYLPDILHADDESGIIIQRWIAVTRHVDFRYSMEIVRNMCAEITGTIMLADAPVQTFLDAVSHLQSLDLLESPTAARRAFDDHAARLQSELHDGVVACRRMHPQIELLRIGEYLERYRSWLPPTYVVRALAEMRRVLRLRRLIIERPAFAHGSFKTEHILASDDRDYVCDFDHAGYYVGPVDIAHWLWDHWEHDPLASRSFRLADLLREYIHDEDDRYLAICWLLAFRLNKDLVFITRGEWAIVERSMASLWMFGDTMVRLGLLG